MTRKLTKKDFTIPGLLVLLSVVPTIGGVVRMLSVARDTTIHEGNARFLHAPTPIVIHVICVTLYCLVGAFQFSKGFRIRWPRWHRIAGRVLVLCGLVGGLTGIWMTAFYAIPAGMQGPLLYVVRLAVGSAMVASLVLGLTSILRRDVARHEAWMIRAYALGQGAGTQVVVMLPWMLITGNETGLTRDLLMALSWGINVVAAEMIVRGRTKAPSKRASALEQSGSRA